jgi:hypothetical protein
MPACSASEAKNAVHGARAPDVSQVMRTAATGQSRPDMGFALKMQVGVFQRERRGKAKEGSGASPMRLGRGAGTARTGGLGACWPLRPVVVLAGVAGWF